MSFIATIQGVRNGALVAKLSEQLDKVAKAVVEHQQQGVLKLEITIKPNGENQVTFVPKVQAKEPTGQIGAAIFYADEDGVLLRTDPRQAEMFDEVGAERAKREGLN